MRGHEQLAERLLAPAWPRRQRGTLSAFTRPPPALRHLAAVRQRSAPLFGLSGQDQAVSTSPYGTLGLCGYYAKVIIHSGATPELDLCEDPSSWPRSCWHLPGHVLDRDTAVLMGW